MAQPRYAIETTTLQRIVRHPRHRFIWTAHALERMLERDISATDVEHALIYGQVVLSEMKKDDVWRVEGSDIDGEPLTVQVVVKEDVILIKVVTAFPKRRR